MDNKMTVRTRFAPSPTGFMHLGNLRSALYTFLLARKNKGVFILRIEDTDQKRYVEGAVEKIFTSLAKAGMDYDEGPNKDGGCGPYFQSKRRGIYKQYAEALVAKKEAYYCFCSKERLESLVDEHGVGRYDRHCLLLTENEIKDKLAQKAEYVIRQKMPDDGEVSFHDVLYGEITVDAKELEDQVLLKSDGMPTYNFANVVDDYLMGITHVMRGNEYLSSTPKYNLLYQAFGWPIPTYIHLSQIMRDERRKLSKRDGDAYFDDFLEKGYLPQAIVNYIALLGWAPKDNQEKFTMDELIAKFDIDGLKKSGSIFDLKKLQWFNQEYLKEMDHDSYLAYLMPFLKKIKADEDDTWYQNMSILLRERLLYGGQASDLYYDFFKEIDSLNAEAKDLLMQDGVLPTIEKLLEAFNQIDEWNEANLISAIKEVGKAQNVKGKMLYMPCRIATTGEMHGPDLGKLLEILKKEIVLERIKQIIPRLKG